MGKLGWFLSLTQTTTSPPHEGEPAGTLRLQAGAEVVQNTSLGDKIEPHSFDIHRSSYLHAQIQQKSSVSPCLLRYTKATDPEPFSISWCCCSFAWSCHQGPISEHSLVEGGVWNTWKTDEVSVFAWVACIRSVTELCFIGSLRSSSVSRL